MYHINLKMWYWIKLSPLAFALETFILLPILGYEYIFGGDTAINRGGIWVVNTGGIRISLGSLMFSLFFLLSAPLSTYIHIWLPIIRYISPLTEPRYSDDISTVHSTKEWYNMTKEIIIIIPCSKGLIWIFSRLRCPHYRSIHLWLALRPGCNGQRCIQYVAPFASGIPPT
jgi:hypothetical protein